MIKNPWDDVGEVTELEWRLQQATANYLSGEEWRGNKIIHRHAIPFHGLKFHHPALEYRGDDEGIKYRKRGTTAGIFDWLLWGPSRWHGLIELKVAGRGLNSNQKTTHHWVTEYGFPFAICRSVKEFRDTIIGWGFECHNMACREPDHRNQEQKFRDAFDFYKP